MKWLLKDGPYWPGRPSLARWGLLRSESGSEPIIDRPFGQMFASTAGLFSLSSCVGKNEKANAEGKNRHLLVASRTFVR